MREEPLSGGRNASEVVRAGGTVRRARDPGSAFAARLLGYLESAGYPHAPRFLGVDDRGRDILARPTGESAYLTVASSPAGWCPSRPVLSGVSELMGTGGAKGRVRVLGHGARCGRQVCSPVV